MSLKFSIIVPFYNTNPDLFLNLVSSIKNQDYDNYELLIIDDGSDNPDSLQALEKAAQNKHVRLFRNEHQGISEARNTGLKNLTGDLLWFVDSDDLILEGAFKTISSFFENNPDYYAYSFRAKFQKNNGKVSKWRIGYAKLKPFDMTSEDLLYSITNSTYYFDGFLWRKVFNLKKISKNKLPLFDIKIEINEDKYWLFDVIQLIKKCRITPLSFYLYNYNPKSITKYSRNNTAHKRTYGNYRILQKLKDIEGSIYTSNYQSLLAFIIIMTVGFYIECFDDKDLKKFLEMYIENFLEEVDYSLLSRRRIKLKIAIARYKLYKKR